MALGQPEPASQDTNWSKSCENQTEFDLDSVPERGCAWLVRRGEGVGDVRGRARLQVLQQPRHGDAQPAWWIPNEILALSEYTLCLKAVRLQGLSCLTKNFVMVIAF